MSPLACELRRLASGFLLSLPLAASATVPEEVFLPPQNIPLPGTMTFGKVVVADVNGDHFDDLVVIGTDAVDGTAQLVIDVYLNEGKTRSTSEAVSFARQRMLLAPHTNREAAEANIRFGTGNDLQIVDLDGDGAPDILASNASTGQIFILWNQGTNAPAPFAYVPDTDLPTSPSMTLMSPLAQRVGGDDVLGTPIFVAAADLGDGSGRKSIVAYHGALPLDSSSHEKAPFNRGNYESLAIIPPTAHTARGFNLFTQRLAWPGCDLAFGSACPGWVDGMTASTPLYNFRLADQSQPSLGVDAAPSDVMDMDGWTTVGTQSFYKPASFHPNASPGLQVLAGHGANGSDAVWLQGGQQINEFVADNALHLMRRRTTIDAVAGNERSAGATFGTLSSGETALITAGGMTVAYDPSNAGSLVTQSVPDYLNRPGQTGAWLGWASLNSGLALLSLSDYCRAPDPCATQLRWYHMPLDGSAPPATFWGGSHSLVMLDMAHETTTPAGKQFEPFFQQPDEARFQAFSIMGGSLTHKPFIASGHFASPTEAALIWLDHADGQPTDPTWNHFALYRPDTSKTYASPTPQLDGLTVGRFIQDGLADIGNTLPKGEVSAVLIGSHLGTDTNDAIRYVTVRDATTHAMKGIFPANPPETVKELHKDGIVVPGLSTLDIGKYILDVHNATASASMPLNIANPYGITTTNYDSLAGKACGLLPDTKSADLWPQLIAVSVTDFPEGKLEAVRWIKQDDGSLVNLGAEGATYDATAKTLTLIIPQNGKLSDGHWRASIKANGMWQPVPRTWSVARDSATLAACAAQVDFVNEEAYAQCTNNDYYLDAAQYKVWPYQANGSFRFFGSGFAQTVVKSVAIKQGGHRYFSSSLELISDNEIHVNFGDLSDKLTPDVATDLYFYNETGDVVEANGVSAVGGKTRWRTARLGSGVPQLPQITQYLNAGSGKDGAWQSGDTIQVAGKNLLYPIPTAAKLVLKGDDDSLYVLENPRLPDDWYTHHYDNDNLVLYFTVPDDLTSARISAKSASGTTALGGGLVVAGAGALATTGVSESGLAALLSNPVTAVATLGATATGLSIYAGVQNTTWLVKKVEMWLAKKTTDPSGISKPGTPADEQSSSLSQRLYLVVFVSQPKVAGNTSNGPVEAIVIKANSLAAAMGKAPIGVGAYMLRWYGQGGMVDFFYTPNGELPVDYVAGITSVHDFGPADGITPSTEIRTKIPLYYSQFAVRKTCNSASWNSIETAETDPNSGLNTEWISFVWRRDVMGENFPPAGCATYAEDIGNIISQRGGYYETDIANNMTLF